MAGWEQAWRPFARTPRCLRLLGSVVLLAAFLLTGQARAASYSSSDAFYFSMPSGHPASAIATSPDGNYVYATDPAGNRVEEFDSDGTVVRGWSYNKQKPSSITTDGFGNVYVLYAKNGTIVKFGIGASKVKVLASWTVPFAGSIAATRGGSVWVLTNFLNAVGEYTGTGKSIGGFVANLPGQWFPRLGFDTRYWPQTGYDPPYKTVAKEIAVDPSGNPVVVGDSYQALSDQQPDCSVPDNDLHIDTRPYPDPLDSGEAARFSPDGAPIAYGWLSLSQQNCYNGLYQQSPGLNVAFGWQSDGTNPGAVAVDPNTGDVYAVTSDQLGVRHLAHDLGDTLYDNIDAASSYGYDHNWDILAGNPAGGVAVDCRSNLYMLGGGAASDLIVKFINSDPVPPGSCTPLNPRLLAPAPSIALLKFHVGKIGKGTAWAACSGRPCNGTLSLISRSPLCRNCTLSRPHHFRIAPGVQRPLSFELTKLGRRLLLAHPGLAIKVTGRLKRGHSFAQNETLRAPATLAERCAFPGASGGFASVSGTLAPGHHGARITIQYLPPESAGLLLPAVQRTVLADRAGHFHDRYPLTDAGKWMIVTNWGGDRTHEPAASKPCSGTVQPIETHITLTCPDAASVGAPAQFAGAISGAPDGSRVELAYVAPPTTDVGHSAIAGAIGNFSDSFSATAPGVWLALAIYKGDASHSPASAACQFTVARSPTELTLQCTPDPNRHFISCTGKLTSDGGDVGGAQVTLTYQPPGGASPTVDSTNTAADGSYSDTLNAPVGSVLASGSWQVQAQFAGDSTHAPASNTQNVTVP